MSIQCLRWLTLAQSLSMSLPSLTTIRLRAQFEIVVWQFISICTMKVTQKAINAFDTLHEPEATQTAGIGLSYQ